MKRKSRSTENTCSELTTNSHANVRIVINSETNDDPINPKVFISLNANEYKNLLDKSEYISQLDQCYTPRQVENGQIELREKDPLDTAAFISHLLKHKNIKSVNNDARHPQWNRAFAELSSKWIIEDEINRFKKMIEDFLKKLQTITSVTVTTLSSSYLCLQNSSYRFEKEVFTKDPEKNKFNSKSSSFYFNYSVALDQSISWSLKYLGNIYYCSTSTGNAQNDIAPISQYTSQISPFPPSGCHWSCSSAVMTLRISPHYDGSFGYDWKDPFIINTFCEMVEVSLTHICYSMNISSKKDLIDILSTNKFLRIREVYDRLLTKEDLITVLEIIDS
jgi:hypothetical protein